MQDQEAGFTRGDRAPDFLLPTVEGLYGHFYDRFRGRAVLFVLLPSADPEALARGLGIFARNAGAVEAAGASLVAVTLADPAANAALAEALDVDFTLFGDLEGKITQGYGAARDEGALTVYLLDRNQRVLAVTQGAAETCLAHALGSLESALPRAQEHQVTAQAPVLLLDDVLERDFCSRLIETWRGDHAEGAVRLRAGLEHEDKTRAVAQELKKRLDHRLDGPLNRELSRLVMRRLGPEVVKSFQFRPAVLEKFCIAAYDAARGDYFRPHRDNATPQTRERRFAVTINLNDDYEGGGLTFPEFGDQRYRTAAGGAVVFSCSLLHEALPVSHGQRFVALSFIYGEEALARAASEAQAAT